MYKILISKIARKFLEEIEQKNRNRIVESIECLIEELRPVGCKKLTSMEGYRILYVINDLEKIINVYRIGNRKDVYR